VCASSIQDLLAIEDRLSVEIWLSVSSFVRDFRDGRIPEPADMYVAQLVKAAESEGWKGFCMNTAVAHTKVAPGVSTRSELKKQVVVMLAKWKKKPEWDQSGPQLAYLGILPEEQMALMLQNLATQSTIVNVPLNNW
jgi:hypothetical protein